MTRTQHRKINYDDPTTNQVEQITAVTQRRLSELQLLSEWSDEQFEQVLFCLVKWSPLDQEWVYDAQALITLAFDARVPKSMVHNLDSMVKHWKENGQPKQYRAFKRTGNK